MKIAGIVLLIVGGVLVNLTSIPLADYIGIASAAFGLAFTIVGVWNTSEKKTWKEIVAIVCFAVAGFSLGFAGVSEEIMTKIITLIVGLVGLILGIIATIKKEKK